MEQPLKPLVAVTGATGFLGRYILAALAARQAKVRVLVRRDFPDSADIEVVRGELEDVACERLVAGADAVIHAAGLIKALRTADFFTVNRDGTAALARTTRRAAPGARFALVSSLAARGPQLSPYAASKAAGEVAARAVYADAPELVILRPTAIYGTGDKATLALLKAAARPVGPVFGHGCLTFIHPTDAADAIVSAALDGGTGCHALTDPNPGGYTMRAVMAAAARATGARQPHLVRVPDAALLAAGHVAALWARLRGEPGIFTAGKAREMLHADWSVTPAETLPAPIHVSRIGLAEGLAAAATWYRANGSL